MNKPLHSPRVSFPSAKYLGFDPIPKNYIPGHHPKPHHLEHLVSKNIHTSTDTNNEDCCDKINRESYAVSLPDTIEACKFETCNNENNLWSPIKYNGHPVPEQWIHGLGENSRSSCISIWLQWTRSLKILLVFATREYTTSPSTCHPHHRTCAYPIVWRKQNPVCHELSHVGWSSLESTGWFQ